jgi:nucleotide-binding universal stress UspA family protein
MIKRIVVPVDFSEVSIRAARFAVNELAPQLDAVVVFVAVLDVGDLRVAMKAGLHGFDTDEELHQKVSEWIEEQFSKIESGDESVKAQRDIRRGVPEREIVEAIREHEADLVVMGSTGITRRIPIGSKTEYVIRHVELPLLLIHGKE